MGASLAFIFVIIIVVLIAGLVFSGVAGKLWSRRTAPPESAPGPDLTNEGDSVRNGQEPSPRRDSTVAPDERGTYHRESR